MIFRFFKKLSSYQLPQTATAPFCPSAVEGSVYVDPKKSFLKRYLVSAGMGVMIAVGYMDPGNWATDIQAGSQFGYQLLWIIFISNLIATHLQLLCIKLGLATDKDLAVHCRENFSKTTNFILWILAELGIVACDIAEVLGTAIAFKLIFNISLKAGILWTAVDTVFILLFQGKGFRKLESIILGLVTTIGICYFVEIILSHPHWGEVATGFIPTREIFSNVDMIVISIGILGATVMPHNLYLHSSIIQTRRTDGSRAAKKDLFNLAALDTIVSLFVAFLINSAILILAAATFHKNGYNSIVDIEEAHRLLEPLLGASAASVLFVVALLASGQSSTITGTIAGQVVLEGFLNLKIPCWQRRMITRALALVPAFIGIYILGEKSAGRLLVWSQVVLSLQLPFAVIPLVYFTNSKKIMGYWQSLSINKIIGWSIALLITCANVWMVISEL